MVFPFYSRPENENYDLFVFRARNDPSPGFDGGGSSRSGHDVREVSHSYFEGFDLGKNFSVLYSWHGDGNLRSSTSLISTRTEADRSGL